MGIRARVVALAVQLAVLLVGTNIATGSPWQNEIWFFSGLLAIVLNRQLVEPFFARPADTLANSLVGLLLFAVAARDNAYLGWIALAILLVLAGVTALLSIWLGRGGARGRRVALASRVLSRRATAVPIYSAIFFLSLAEAYTVSDAALWILAVTWLVTVVIGGVDWSGAWGAARSTAEVSVEGFTGPSLLAVTSNQVPTLGTAVVVRKGEESVPGTVVRRVARVRDVYAEVHIAADDVPERFLSGRISMEVSDRGTSVVGVVDHGSTDQRLRFAATRELAIGETVFVRSSRGDNIAYQLIEAVVSRHDERDGAFLETVCKAVQIGTWDSENARIVRHPWVPPPGAAVGLVPRAPIKLDREQDRFAIGSVIGSPIPVTMDLDAAATGHVVILGMTKMGKTTFALRLAAALAASRPVVILDQTGEYGARHGVPICTAQALQQPGLSLKEPAKGEVGPQVALDFFERLLEEMAHPEYADDETQGRTIVVEEAHQFIPEPAGLGFGTPGREEAYKLGTLMMQIRKYGLSVVLISQRTAVVGKSALSQCENVIAFRSVDRTGLDYLEGIMGPDAAALLPRLRQGQAVVAGPAFNIDEPVAVDVNDQ